MGTIFDIKRFALHDGPGIRTTVFFKGCPMHCLSCHNPESQAFEVERFFRADRCRGCGECIEVCEGEALSLSESGMTYEQTLCTRCRACAAVCSTGAANLAGRDVTPEEVMTEVEKDRIFFEQSGGGVTFSGGEPLAQPAFLADLARASGERGWHVTVDTSGYAPWKTIRNLCPDVDLFLYDLKLLDEERHRAFTGVSNRLPLKNLRALCKENARVVVRIPLIPGINDDSDHLHRLGDFSSRLENSPPVELLPYHRAGTGKYPRLNRGYELEEIRPPSTDRCNEAIRILQDHGLQVLIKGNQDESQ